MADFYSDDELGSCPSCHEALVFDTVQSLTIDTVFVELLYCPTSNCPRYLLYTKGEPDDE